MSLKRIINWGEKKIDTKKEMIWRDEVEKNYEEKRKEKIRACRTMLNCILLPNMEVYNFYFLYWCRYRCNQGGAIQ